MAYSCKREDGVRGSAASRWMDGVCAALLVRRDSRDGGRLGRAAHATGSGGSQTLAAMSCFARPPHESMAGTCHYMTIVSMYRKNNMTLCMYHKRELISYGNQQCSHRSKRLKLDFCQIKFESCGGQCVEWYEKYTNC
jgi:hypothetical protein